MQSLSRSFTTLLGILFVAAVIGQCHGNRSRRQIFPGSRPACATGTTCMSLRTCPSLAALLQTPTIQNLRILQRALCGFNRRDARVCCPSSGSIETTPDPIITTITTITTETTTPTQPPTITTISPGDSSQLPARCGEPAIRTRIFFGQNAPLGTYTWMALIGFSSRGSSNIVWGCGGALINSRYVVTAGHCTAAQFTNNRPLSVVRLGEHNIGNNPDCETPSTGRRCAPAHQDFTPEQIIRHPDFNTRGTVSDDIALIRLNRPAVNNGYVMPICLPAPGLTVASIVGSRQAEVAGWGTTERGPNTQVLQTVRLPFVSQAECNTHYDNALIEEQVCFGGDGRRDSCFGDSGGPVMIAGTSNPNYALLGLVSFGQPQCGVEGVPAVYTDITAYRSWIISNLRA